MNPASPFPTIPTPLPAHPGIQPIYDAVIKKIEDAEKRFKVLLCTQMEQANNILNNFIKAGSATQKTIQAAKEAFNALNNDLDKIIAPAEIKRVHESIRAMAKEHPDIDYSGNVSYANDILNEYEERMTPDISRANFELFSNSCLNRLIIAKSDMNKFFTFKHLKQLIQDRGLQEFKDKGPPEEIEGKFRELFKQAEIKLNLEKRTYHLTLQRQEELIIWFKGQLDAIFKPAGAKTDVSSAPLQEPAQSPEKMHQKIISDIDYFKEGRGIDLVEQRQQADEILSKYKKKIAEISQEGKDKTIEAAQGEFRDSAFDVDKLISWYLIALTHKSLVQLATAKDGIKQLTSYLERADHVLNVSKEKIPTVTDKKVLQAIAGTALKSLAFLESEMQKQIALHNMQKLALQITENIQPEFVAQAKEDCEKSLAEAAHKLGIDDPAKVLNKMQIAQIIVDFCTVLGEKIKQYTDK